MLDNQAVNARNSPAKLFGAVSSIVPPGDWPITTADAAWGEAIAEIPYQSLKQYGDVTLMRGAYDGIRAYWEFLKNQSDPKTGPSKTKPKNTPNKLTQNVLEDTDGVLRPPSREHPISVLSGRYR